MCLFESVGNRWEQQAGWQPDYSAAKQTTTVEQMLSARYRSMWDQVG